MQVGHEYADEWHVVRRKCWAAFHARARIWRMKLHALHKVRMLQTAILPVLNWCSASRCWKKAELAFVRTMQLRVCADERSTFGRKQTKSSLSSFVRLRDGRMGCCRRQEYHAGMWQ